MKQFQKNQEILVWLVLVTIVLVDKINDKILSIQKACPINQDELE